MTPILLALFLSAGPGCVEKNLAYFYSHGKEIQVEIVGQDDPCDGFGGAYAYTPKYRIYVYVNFNIPAWIYLDSIDRSLDRLSPAAQKFFKGIDLAIADADFMARRFNGADASLNWAGNTLFISEVVAGDSGDMERLFWEFYMDPEEGP